MGFFIESLSVLLGRLVTSLVFILLCWLDRRGFRSLFFLEIEALCHPFILIFLVRCLGRFFAFWCKWEMRFFCLYGNLLVEEVVDRKRILGTNGNEISWYAAGGDACMGYIW